MLVESRSEAEQVKRSTAPTALTRFEALGAPPQPPTSVLRAEPREAPRRAVGWPTQTVHFEPTGELRSLRKLRGTAEALPPRPASAGGERSVLAMQMRAAARGHPLRERSWKSLRDADGGGGGGGSARGAPMPPATAVRRPVQLPKPETPRRTCLMSAKAGAAGWY